MKRQPGHHDKNDAGCVPRFYKEEPNSNLKNYFCFRFLRITKKTGRQNFPPMRAHEFLTGHVIFKLRYNQIYQLKTTIVWNQNKEIHKCRYCAY